MSCFFFFLNARNETARCTATAGLGWARPSLLFFLVHAWEVFSPLMREAHVTPGARENNTSSKARQTDGHQTGAIHLKWTRSTHSLFLSPPSIHPSIHPLARCCRLLSSLDPNFRNKDQAFNVAEHAHWEQIEKKKKHPFELVRAMVNWKQSISRNERNNNKLLNENQLFSLRIWKKKRFSMFIREASCCLRRICFVFLNTAILTRLNLPIFTTRRGPTRRKKSCSVKADGTCSSKSNLETSLNYLQPDIQHTQTDGSCRYFLVWFRQTFLVDNLF